MANLHWNSEGTGQILPPPIDLPSERRQNKSKEPLNGFSQFLKSYWLLLLLGAGAIIIGLLPYRFNSGGSIQLYPPKQQLISSDVAGTLKKVFFPGGNGKFIKAGEVIAVLDSPELQNQLLTSQDKVTQQAATVREDEANLQKLLNTPRPEDIAVAKEKVSIARNNVNVAANQVQVARSNVMLAANQVQVARSNTRVAIQKVEISRSNLKVAQTQLVTGASEADYSRREAERYKESYEGGVYSLQQYESQQKKADTDALQIDTFKSSIDQARSQLETSKQDLVVAENNLASAQQQLVISKNTLEVSLQQLNTAKSSNSKFKM